MNGNPKDSKSGYVCPIRGCKKRKTTLYSLNGLIRHMNGSHPGVVEKRLRLKRGTKSNRRIEIQDGK